MTRTGSCTVRYGRLAPCVVVSVFKAGRLVQSLKPFIFIKRFYSFIVTQGKGGRKRGRETSVFGCLLRTPHWRPKPATQACALTGNRTRDPLVCSQAQSTEPQQPGARSSYLNVIPRGHKHQWKMFQCV